MRKFSDKFSDDNDDDDYPDETSEYAEFDGFFQEGLITEVLYTVKSGKEATVYCCKAGHKTGVDLLAAKLYRLHNNRNFKNDAVYREGRPILNQRDKRAFAKKSEWGRQVQAGTWLHHEYEVLNALRKAGADVPKTYGSSGNAILLDFLGDYQAAAPILQNVELGEQEARPLFEVALGNIELWLKHNQIHADLSPYNIIYWEGRLTFIDFPQAIDPRFNLNAPALLERDIANLCRYWKRYGVEANASTITRDLWTRFRNSQL